MVRRCSMSCIADSRRDSLDDPSSHLFGFESLRAELSIVGNRPMSCYLVAGIDCSVDKKVQMKMIHLDTVVFAAVGIRRAVELEPQVVLHC